MNGKKKPQVTVIKESRDNSPFPSIEYQIKDSASNKPAIYSLDDFEEQLLYRDYQASAIRRELLRRRQRTHNHSILEHLESLVKVSWLSVHRTHSLGETDRNVFVSTVDKKLNELSNRLVRYFSSLGKQGANLLEKFQETIFLSLLINKGQQDIFNVSTHDDVEEERETLNTIFQQFKLDPKRYVNRVNSHFDILKSARRQIADNKGLGELEIAALIGTDRIHRVVQEWNKMLEDRERIYEPRETFLKIINSLMQRKKFSINAQNELIIKTQSGKDLPLKLLSSGEKQLLIVLGEALLQEKASWIYIADEPELSLHITWQEKLVDNLRAINPSAQIVFATHSPDVVSHYNTRVFDMEKQFR